MTEKDYLTTYWREIYQKDAGQSELNPVCCPGRSVYFNQLVDHFQRISFLKGLKTIGDISGLKALDIGCGTGRWSILLSQLGAIVTGIDISENVIIRNRQKFPNIHFEHMRAEQLDLPDNFFDLISSITVLQHLPHQKKKLVIFQMSRCLKKGGYLIILEKICQHQDKKLIKLKQITFPLSPKEWISIFEKYGFKLLNTHRHLLLPLINNFYIPLERRVADLFKWIFKIKSLGPNPNFDGIGSKKKYILSGIESNINNWVYLFLTFPSYFIEYLLLLLKVDTWTWQYLLGRHQTFVFKKER